MATRRRAWRQACPGHGAWRARRARLRKARRCVRPAFARSTGPTRRRWAKRSGARAICSCRCRRMPRAIRCWRGIAAIWRRRATLPGSDISRRRASMATEGRLGGRGERARTGQCPQPLAGGDRGRPGWRAACRYIASGSPGSTGRGAARSTGCARVGRSGSSSRGRCSAASMSMTSPGCWPPPSPDRRRGRVWNLADDEPAPPQDVDRLCRRTCSAAGPAGHQLRDGGAYADGAVLLRGIEARVEPQAERGARRDVGLSGLPRRASRRFSRRRMRGGCNRRWKTAAASDPHWHSRALSANHAQNERTGAVTRAVQR